jgi:hypothetical protein
MAQEAEQPESRFRHAKIQAANRAEATALLIRCGYAVYRSEADCEGEDLVVRTPAGKLLAVQLKGRPVVDWRRYGTRDLWMLFPSHPFNLETPRDWYLLPHDHFYTWVESRHGGSPKWASHWTYSTISEALRTFLTDWILISSSEPLLDEIRG